MNKQKLLAIARGEEKADLVIKNVKIINVYTKDVDLGNLAIADGIVIGIGNYEGENEIDFNGYYLAPGFIDGHVHIESSMLVPNNYALAVMPRGTTSVIADCHEIANVCGTNGIDYMLKSAKASPLDVFMMIPSCVPSSAFETSGAVLNADDIKKYLKEDRVKGLGEMMDYKGAINGEKSVLDKINLFKSLTIDGHAPEVKEKELNAYILSGVETDHECTTPEELIEKVKKGMYIHLREGSQTKNVLDLLPGLNPSYYNRIIFCSDDLHPSDIKKIGHMDNNINIAIKYGIDPIEAISMATINIANCYNIKSIGALSPGRKADFVAFKNLDNIDIEYVYKNGVKVAEKKKALFETENIVDNKVMNTVNINLNNLDLTYSVKKEYLNVIGLIKNNVTTKSIIEKVVLDNNIFYPKNNPNLLKLVVVERHHASKNLGKAIVKGYGLKNSAIAMTVSHDSHNLICIGDNDLDMMIAIKKISELSGGIVIVSNSKVLDYLKLEVAGLMSLDSLEFVEKKLNSLVNYARSLGVSNEIEDPLLQLAFLSLAVIPELKVTDYGLFDVNKFKIISLETSDLS
ncbi:MAG: adenine deaminase [Candidatus Izemoplasmatales bacterium]